MSTAIMQAPLPVHAIDEERLFIDPFTGDITSRRRGIVAVGSIDALGENFPLMAFPATIKASEVILDPPVGVYVASSQALVVVGYMDEPTTRVKIGLVINFTDGSYRILGNDSITDLHTHPALDWLFQHFKIKIARLVARRITSFRFD